MQNSSVCDRYQQPTALLSALAVWYLPLPKPKVSLESGGVLGTLNMLSISGEPYAPNSVGERYATPEDSW